ncbi:MAG: choice-of-anchor D domain-containing protein, partial [Gemmatimonadetes bacterium]
TLTITSDDDDESTVTIPLTGVAIPLIPEIEVSPLMGNFGTIFVDETSTVTFTLSNLGNTPLHVGGQVISGTNADEFSIIDGAGSVVIEAGEQHVTTVQFAPVSAGSKLATLTISSDDPDNPTVDIILIGTGVQLIVDDQVHIQPANWDFGQVLVGGSAVSAFAVTNTGTEPVTILSQSFVGSQANQFSVLNGGSFSLDPGELRLITVQFSPLSVGTKTATLLVTTTDGSSATAFLQGTGQNPFDVNGDGQVDIDDVQSVIQHWSE